MKEKKRISPVFTMLLFGIVMLVLSFYKLLFTESSFSSFFFVAEFLTYGLILLILYYLEYCIKKRDRLIAKKQSENENLKREFSNRESDLLIKILKLEEKELEEMQFTVNKEKTISKIFQTINSKGSKEEIATQFLSALSKSFELVQGIFYLISDDKVNFNPIATYAIDTEIKITPFTLNDGFCGQAVSDKKILTISDVPEDYLVTYSGLGQHEPVNLYFIPILQKDKAVGLIEIGTFRKIEISRIWDEINNKLIDLLKIR